MSDVIIGIDLGTTNSEVAVVQNGIPVVLTGEDGDPILPSVVGLSDQGKLLVGKPARNQYPLFPERTIKSIKRLMGKDEKIKLGDREYRPPEISAMILKALKERAEKALGHSVNKAVITVPAYFNDTQRQATIEAGSLAGLEVKRILNEPTAAALVYDPQQTAGLHVLVYDLGGGTFDVSIVHWEQGIVEVLASHGDTQLGGDDFDELLLNHVAGQFMTEHQIDLRTDRSTRARLLRACENAKKQLSDFAFTKVEEEFIAEKDGVPLHLSMEVSRGDFEKLIQPLIDRTMDSVQKALNDSKLSASQIDRVVLVGGSTRTPVIGIILENLLGRPPRRDINPDLCVAMGAAVQAAMIAGSTVGAVLVDITPHSLGIKTLDPSSSMYGERLIFTPIVRRGTPLPVSRSEVFRTVTDHQPRVEIDVYQGESENLRQNHRVGMFLIEGLGKFPAGNQIVVQLDLTLDGVLKVSAREKATGLSKQIVIDNALETMDSEERAESANQLDELWRDRFQDDLGEDSDEIGDESDDDEGLEYEPNEAARPMPMMDVGPREGQREAVQARALLEKADRLRTKATSEDQAELDRLMQNVRVSMEDRNWPKLEQASNALADVLFYLEDA
ncbi:Hsp70 family protein [Zavarzinella formosa]|uniref:Hsp70 family protein n=1 Tax=Zavarzinella formosa TaxID=360055 RepID=UPI000304570A|nr:Hsp70 family protein [Zavarzinella formosa]